jgi:hypothetical protein
LDHAIREGFTIRPFTLDVFSDVEILIPGSYFCNASSGPIAVNIPPGDSLDGYIINIKKMDPTGNKVVVTSTEGIDGLQEIEICLQYENLQIQFHDGRWHIL